MMWDVGEMVPRRWGSNAPESGTVLSQPAVSEARCSGSGGHVVPSRATIAPFPRRRLPWAAIRAIKNDGTDDTHTQHWPQLTAGTNAPWHTRTTWLPSPPTSWHWKAVPVSPPTTDEDENGDATATVRAVHARWVVKCDSSDDNIVVGGVLYALVKRAIPVTPPHVALPPAAPSPASSVTSLPRAPTAVPTPFLRPPPFLILGVCVYVNLAGTIQIDTHTARSPYALRMADLSAAGVSHRNLSDSNAL